MIADAESVAVDDAAPGLVARAADGSKRDAQCALDQGLPLPASGSGSRNVSTVVGLIGRDAVLDAVAAVADEGKPPDWTASSWVPGTPEGAGAVVVVAVLNA